MAAYAEKLSKAEAEEFTNSLNAFAANGNDMMDYDPSDIEEDEEIEEIEEVLEDATGDDDLEILKKFYLVSAEMTDDKAIQGKKKKRISQADIWAEILRELELNCKDLAKVIELILVIPSSTAEVERFFKVLKEMKSKKRNQLKAQKLRNIFLIYHFLDLENYDKEQVDELFQTFL